MPAQNGSAFSVEEFLQSLTSQLDRAQDMLAMKVRGLRRPLTWALKDLALELRVFVDIDQAGRVRLRNAGPNDQGASTVHLSLTTITRPMVEENTLDLSEDSDPRTLDSLRDSAHIDAEDQRRLELMGVRTVGQLRRLSNSADPRAVQNYTGIPVDNLRAALMASARPAVTGHDYVRQRGGETLLRIQGANLTEGQKPEVHLAGEPVEVVEATPSALLVRPLAHHREGPVEVRIGHERATGWFRTPDGAGGAARPPQPRPGPAPEGNGARDPRSATGAGGPEPHGGDDLPYGAFAPQVPALEPEP